MGKWIFFNAVLFNTQVISLKDSLTSAVMFGQNGPTFFFLIFNDFYSAVQNI